MPRVHHVKKARKDNPVAKKGESYYWWKFRYGGKRYSKTPPKASQLTQSPYYANLYDLIDEIEESDCANQDEFESLRDRVSEALQEFGQECQDSLDNMPDSLQYSPTGELLQERIDACDSASSDVECLPEFDEPEPDSSDFDEEEECETCEGRGHIDPEDEEDTCADCDGEGKIMDDSEYHNAVDEWEENERQHYEEQKSEMVDYVSNCIC